MVSEKRKGERESGARASTSHEQSEATGCRFVAPDRDWNKLAVNSTTREPPKEGLEPSFFRVTV
ncbi:hypothetical protein M199_gp221 [Halogranum tailed virus 1]|uniref:Uncharacterized protein n=1 Tax=Halogranum tailed virus 1 TaxID=1273749 RepID=R4T969_9CAUD|nr:hypothetical protein M199_gp221 [Halogranum tailed virus 1]AGM11445.1 hypothetical protein HGTV1_148 [Halogranum tailed virus 1]